MKIRFCKNPECFDFATEGAAKLNPRQKRYCSPECQNAARRGSGKSYIRIIAEYEETNDAGELVTVKRRVYLHRWVMEQKLNRRLEPGEVVHHLDHNKFNNDESNLMLFASQTEHYEYHRTHLNPEYINDDGFIQEMNFLYYEAAAAEFADIPF
jgi:hypothetical protein